LSHKDEENKKNARLALKPIKIQRAGWRENAGVLFTASTDG
jgi:hypothetical protein